MIFQRIGIVGILAVSSFLVAPWATPRAQDPKPAPAPAPAPVEPAEKAEEAEEIVEAQHEAAEESAEGIELYNEIVEYGKEWLPAPL
jgi:hypothetical protein